MCRVFLSIRRSFLDTVLVAGLALATLALPYKGYAQTSISRASAVPTVVWESKPNRDAIQGRIQSGTVIVQDSSGNPAQGQRLEVFANLGGATQESTKDRLIGRLMTGADGRAAINGLSLPYKGNLRLFVRSESGSTSDSVDIYVAKLYADSIVIRRGLPTSIENGITVSPAPQLVVYSDRKELAGAVVTLSVAAGDAALSGDQVTTNENGIADFQALRISALCTPVGCNKQEIVGSAGAVQSRVMKVAVRARTPMRLVLLPGSGREITAGAVMVPGIQVRVFSGDDQPLPGIEVVARTGGTHTMPLTQVPTDANGIASFNNLRVDGSVGRFAILFSAGSAQVVDSFNLRAGKPVAIAILRQPPPRFVADSVWKTPPRIRVSDSVGNPVANVEVRAKLCWQMLEDTTAIDGVCTVAPVDRLASLEGATSVRTDTNGEAEFVGMHPRGRSGKYWLQFYLPAPSAVAAFTTPTRYYPKSDFDQNMVGISAIKTISGTAPSDEFFDLRFRFRLGSAAHVIANTDIALSSRNTDSVSSPQKRLTEATLMLNANVHFVCDPTNDVPQRLLFSGIQSRVFNTVQYVGLHVGGSELGGSIFQGSSLSVSLLRRFYSDTLVVVNGDSINTARHNLGFDFFLRSSVVDFFKVLTIRGGIVVPFSARARPTARIAIAVPLGDVYKF